MVAKYQHNYHQITEKNSPENTLKYTQMMFLDQNMDVKNMEITGEEHTNAREEQREGQP